MPLLAPEFPANFKWINSNVQLQLNNFRGHPVLIHFWSYCCVHCITIQNELNKIEQEFCRKGLVVIGVHSAKFQHEKEYENVREACHKLNILNPVIVDEELQIWKKYAIRNYPSFVLIDKEGKIIQANTGEDQLINIKETINNLLKNVTLPEIPISSWNSFDDKYNLRYPAKAVVAEIDSNIFYFISDSFNNRIVQLNSEGKFICSFGEGVLNFPQGACVWKNELIVCDTGNHRVLAFDLEANPQRKYRVLAGKGEKGVFETKSEYTAKLSPLNNPSDVCVWGNDLAISCSGSHQIVLYISKDDSVCHVAGSGKEDLIDGPASFAALAQPSGLAALSPNILAFTDAETSSIRLMIKNWNDSGKTVVVSLVSGGLSEFGFADGLGAEAKMQYPLSCAWSPKTKNIYVVDTYNNALRVYSVDRDYLGTVSLDVNLNEPSGIVWYLGKLVVSDTNSHRILIISEDEIILKQENLHLDTIKVDKVLMGPFVKVTDIPKTNNLKNYV